MEHREPDELPGEQGYDPVGDDGEPASLPASPAPHYTPPTERIRELLLEGLSPKDVAEAVGVSHQRVYEARGSTGSREAVQSEREREIYRDELMRLMPVRLRAARLAELAQSSNPIVALRAMEMADELSRVDAAAQTAPAVVPIFALPKGTREPVRRA